ncbi:putative transposase [Xanthomonas oryzae pv. oryzae KACC 10331]|uniref:Transposase n=1 Tax=Xanthomonas oryzae pv. oryzae (strain KACC10331 / KXO85) TaxID=291331 RepID=Q5GZF9_XANOR|nr:putative transposase [Xanthomonas oryzae pv. oryzae KACC 10331]
MQLTFGDAEGLGKRKQTRREIFLAEMERIVPWKRLLALIEPHYPVSGRPGRQPYALARMLRIHLLQQWYALSDPAMEEALHEIPTLRRFAQLGGLDNVPDETTILNFRRLLETHGIAARMLEAVNAHLSRKGQSLRSGTIVDATLIAAPSSTKNADRARDPEMHQTKKGNQWYFGMKAHIGVDEFSGLVHHVQCTAANVADVTVTHALLHGKEDSVFGDSGYTGAEKRDELQSCEAAFFIAAKRSTIQAMCIQARACLGRTLGTLQGKRAREGGAPIPGDQAAVRLHQGALSRPGQEHRTGADVICAVESVDGAPALAAGQGIMLPGGSQNRQNVAKIAPDSAFFQGRLQL